MELIPITRSGHPARPLVNPPDIVDRVLTATARMYDEVGYQAPWLGYLAVADGEPVGTCAFNSPPRDHSVEIAFLTFPEHEGRGIATEMARKLIDIARNHDPTLTITAQTPPNRSASTKVLEKLGFHFSEEIDQPNDGTAWKWKLEQPPPMPPDQGE